MHNVPHALGMLKQVKPHFVNRNLTCLSECLTLIGILVCIVGFAGTKYYGPTLSCGP